MLTCCDYYELPKFWFSMKMVAKVTAVVVFLPLLGFVREGFELPENNTNNGAQSTLTGGGP